MQRSSGEQGWPPASTSDGWIEAVADRVVGGRSRLTGLGLAWFAGAVAISLLLLLTTAADTFFDPAGRLDYVLAKLNLKRENNFAATWSGMLLALASVHAFDGYARERLRSPASALGWALIAVVLLALSADEVGSLHERVGVSGRLLGIGSWWALLPFALALGGMLAWALILLWREPGNRSTVVQLLLGFVVMSSAALHEFVEHRIELTTAGAEALRAVLEEGSELCGLLILLQVVMRNTAGLSTGRRVDDAAFEAMRELRPLLASGALVLAPFLAYWTAGLTDDHRGHPADWAAAILFLAAALSACRGYFAGGQGLGWDRWLFLALCGLALVGVIDSDPERTITLGPLVVNVRLIVVASLGLLAWSIWPSDPKARSRRAYAIGGILLAVLVGASLLPLGLFATYLLSQLVALTVFVACTQPDPPAAREG